MIAPKIKRVISFLTSKKNLPAIFSLFLLLVILPTTLAVVKISQDLRKKAAEPISYPPSYPPPSQPPTSKNPVLWKTQYANFMADDFYIIANGQKYLAKAVPVSVHSDPGSYYYTTLEIDWEENGNKMRFYLYFDADPNNWWVSEMRHYNGRQDPLDDISYKGPFFKSPRGSSFHGVEYNLITNPTNPQIGQLHFENFYIEPSFQSNVPGCYQSCQSDSNCFHYLVCHHFIVPTCYDCPAPSPVCVKAECPLDKTCKCLPSTPTPSPTPTCQPEELTVPFKNGTNGLATKNAYQGQSCFPITVSGVGQASGTAYSDAFYVYTDNSGKSLQTPIHFYDKQFNWTLWINGGSAENIIKGNQVPPYNSNHVYTFSICLPSSGSQVINFSIGDTYTPDNSGYYTIKTCLSTPPPTPTPPPTTPPPTPICKTGVNSFSVNTPCLSGRYRYAEFTCYDGYHEKVGDPSSCKTSADWQSYAEQKCYGHSSCPPPTPSPRPTNHPPQITTKIQPNQTISVTQNTSKSYSVSVSDPEKQDVKLSLNQSPQSPVFTKLMSTQTINLYRLVLQPTSKTTARIYTVTLKATDSDDPPASSSISFKVKVVRNVLQPFCDRFPFLFWCR